MYTVLQVYSLVRSVTQMTLLEQATQAKQSSYQMMTLGAPVRDAALKAMAEALVAHTAEILEANARDIAAAKAAGRTDALIDRLRLDENRIAGMASGLLQVAALKDPIGSEDFVIKRPNGLSIGRRRVPLGVVGIIYEARPNVTSDAIGLCIKSGNAVLLRGGSEAIHSNTAIARIVAAAGYLAGLPNGCIHLVEDTSRETATEMMTLSGYLDVLIPRGGASLIQAVVKNATVPVIETGVGICHTYVDATANVEMAASIVYNAKVSRPAVCNALETLLIDENAVSTHLGAIIKPLIARGVELRGCEKTRAAFPSVLPATEEDYFTEYHDYILSIRVVENRKAAIAHINHYGSGHSECIVTNDYAAAEHFLNAVDAAAVYVNASTRFTDGEEFGLGAEIGISTQKLHARGPMGPEALTSVKYIVRGSGQIR
ncbi:glutamate-5-semialdehyde dehydrogenase [Christensenellaceae bacterium OttesenSCG-928-L17]|nr:glutamate-5-semialdehyde dehydrogenase [Christensenellaceae bacterium OttesenSCG-928-L17]